MKRIHIIGAAMLAVVLAACGGAPASSTNNQARTAVASQSAAAPTPLPTTAPVALEAIVSANAVNATGEIKAAQTADMVFTVNGTVAQVFVSEGDVVTATQELVQLNQSTFELSVRQAEAALVSAQASEAGLEEAPDKSRIAQASAAVRQAQIALEQAKNNQAQNSITGQSQLDAAQSSLQQTRDRLSATKTQAEQSLQQATNTLTQAQSSYATAKKNWEYVQETGNDPTTPSITNSKGQKVPNKLKDTQVQQYYDTFVKAEAGLRSAESTVASAQVAYDNARQAEVTGVEQAEAQVTQAQAGFDKLKLPTNADSVALAQAQLDQSKASLAQLYPNPTKAQRASASAGIAQAQVQLETAQLNLQNSTLRAPFDGVVSKINVDPGDPSSSSQGAVVSVVDVSKLNLEVSVSDVDIGKVKLGQKTTVVVDGSEKDEYSGTVSYIAPTATANGNARSFVVRITLEDTNGLRPGMRGRAAIQVK